MDVNLYVSRWTTLTGAAVMLVGGVHNAAAPFVLPGTCCQLAAPEANLLVFSFLATGTGLLLAGVLSAWAGVRLLERERWAWWVAALCGAFAAVVGVGGVVVVPANPFAWLLLGASLAQVAPLVLWRGRVLRPLLHQYT